MPGLCGVGVKWVDHDKIAVAGASPDKNAGLGGNPAHGGCHGPSCEGKRWVLGRPVLVDGASLCLRDAEQHRRGKRRRDSCEVLCRGGGRGSVQLSGKRGWVISCRTHLPPVVRGRALGKVAEELLCHKPLLVNTLERAG